MGEIGGEGYEAVYFPAIGGGLGVGVVHCGDAVGGGGGDGFDGLTADAAGFLGGYGEPQGGVVGAGALQGQGKADDEYERQ